MSSPAQPLTWDDLNATRLTARIGYSLAADGTLTLWHWCMATSQWTSTAITADKVTDASPLNAIGRIDLTCCGLHGHIHDGTWIPTNPPHASSSVLAEHGPEAYIPLSPDGEQP